MKLVKDYIPFYLHGREEDVFDDDEIDLDDLVDRALAGPDSPHTIAIEVGTKLASTLEHDREKREWLADNKEMILEAGGDKELAFKHYVQGRVDQYAHSLEDDIVSGMFEDDGDDEDDDDEDEE